MNPMTARPTVIPLQATEQLVDALNGAVELEGDASSRIEFLLHRLQALVNRQTRCALWSIQDLARQPAPRITSRTVVRPAFEDGPLGAIEQAQQVFDECVPINQIMLRGVLERIRTPVTIIASGAGPQEWFDSVLVGRFLGQMGYVDCIMSMWAATEDRAMCLLCHRRAADPPFGENDVALVSLMLRAAAPIVDRELFRAAPPIQSDELSQREREILLMLLAGESEKEIAARLHRSVHTVHTFVGQLHRRFNVSSRGELMALFVDKAVIASIRQELPA